MLKVNKQNQTLALLVALMSVAPAAATSTAAPATDATAAAAKPAPAAGAGAPALPPVAVTTPPSTAAQPPVTATGTPAAGAGVTANPPNNTDTTEAAKLAKEKAEKEAAVEAAKTAVFGFINDKAKEFSAWRALYQPVEGKKDEVQKKTTISTADIAEFVKANWTKVAENTELCKKIAADTDLMKAISKELEINAGDGKVTKGAPNFFAQNVAKYKKASKVTQVGIPVGIAALVITAAAGIILLASESARKFVGLGAAEQADAADQAESDN